MKTIYNVAVCDDEIGEVEGMFTQGGLLLGFWPQNDATWREEYFNGFLEALGITTCPPPTNRVAELEARLIKEYKENTGL
jgi:hypothetical protein